MPEESWSFPFLCPICLAPHRDISTLIRHYGIAEGQLVESGLQSKAIHETKRAAKRVTKVAVATGKQLKEKRAQWGQQFRRMGEARNMVEARNKLIIKIKQPKQP